MGSFYKGLGKIVELITTGLIFVLELIVNLIDNIKKVFAMFGFLIIFAILNPYIMILFLSNRYVLILMLVLFVVPMLGKGLISYLKYLQFMVTEFFYDRADYHILGKKSQYTSMGDYGRKYTQDRQREAQEAQRRAEEASRRRAYQQQQQWEEVFRQFYEQQSRGGGYYRDTRGQGPGYGPYGGGTTYVDPTNSFINKYEESLKVLGLPITTDKYEIKLAYRKMAKKYHPDVNKSPDATAMFQKVNDANEFLSDANIERYKSLKRAS